MDRPPASPRCAGHGGTVHTPHYDFNDDAIGVGVAFWDRLVRQQLSTEEAGDSA